MAELPLINPLINPGPAEVGDTHPRTPANTWLEGILGEKPANGFEPMAFALQKRCSTTELSRQRRHGLRRRAYRLARAQSSSWLRLLQPLLASRLDTWHSIVR